MSLATTEFNRLTFLQSFYFFLCFLYFWTIIFIKNPVNLVKTQLKHVKQSFDVTQRYSKSSNLIHFMASMWEDPLFDNTALLVFLMLNSSYTVYRKHPSIPKYLQVNRDLRWPVKFNCLSLKYVSISHMHFTTILITESRENINIISLVL